MVPVINIHTSIKEPTYRYHNDNTNKILILVGYVISKRIFVCTSCHLGR